MRRTLTRAITLGVLSLFCCFGAGPASGQQLSLSDYEPAAEDAHCGCGSIACDTCSGSRCLDCCLLPCTETIWVQSDYLLWWTKGNRLPALVTTSPPNTPRDEAGVLGFPDTEILFGDERVDANLRHGVRYKAGMWLDPFNETAIQGHYLYLNDGNNTGDYFAASDGAPILARPFFNTSQGAEDSQLIGFPNVVRGQIQIETASEMHSAGILLRRAGWRGGNISIDLLAGYRYLRYREGISIRENLVIEDVPGFVTGTLLDVTDQFVAENDFHGGEIGIHSTYYHCSGLTLDMVAKLALGNVHQDLEVNGVTRADVPTIPPETFEGGLLALPTNIGQRTRNSFAFVPEVNANVRYPLTDCLRLNVGYSLLFLTKAIRSGDQIDTVINPDQFPQNGGGTVDPARPAPLLEETSIWAQGINIGIEWFR